MSSFPPFNFAHGDVAAILLLYFLEVSFFMFFFFLKEALGLDFLHLHEILCSSPKGMQFWVNTSTWTRSVLMRVQAEGWLSVPSLPLCSNKAPPPKINHGHDVTDQGRGEAGVYQENSGPYDVISLNRWHHPGRVVSQSQLAFMVTWETSWVVAQAHKALLQ